MKKNYFFVMIMALAMVNMNAQFTDDMEGYTDGSPIFQDHWSSWGQGTSDAILSSSAQAHSGALSGYVDGGGVIDGVLDMGNKIFGQWGLSFWMYIPSGKRGYFNIQGTIPIGSGEWAVGNIHFWEPEAGVEGEGLVDYSTSTDTEWDTFIYPSDQWFEIIMNFDISTGISNATWEFAVDGVNVTGGMKAFKSYDTDGNLVAPTSLGGLDFFSIDSGNEYYIDDFNYVNEFIPILSLEEIEDKGFAAFPNPVNDVLNLRADESISDVTIHNILGQQVYSTTVNDVQAKIDMSDFAKGAYFVTVKIGSTVGTIKVLK